MRTMHLFAGAGGGLLADLILGHDPIIAVEWDSYCCQVLRERAAEGWFPNLRVWEGDVRLFDPSEYAGKVDCIHAGFPCQDISVAGKQAGVGEETRSGLYREVLRIAGVVRPSYLFLENVAAIINNGLGTVIADLTKIGYDTEWLCLRASDCWAPHYRDRWWLLAHSRRNTDEFKRTGGERSIASGEVQGETWKQRVWFEIADGSQNVAYTNCWIREALDEIGILGKKNSEGSAIRYSDGDLQGYGFWAVESSVGRVANGVPNRIHRLKGLGNAQVPLQAAVAWKLLGGE